MRSQAIKETSLIALYVLRLIACDYRDCLGVPDRLPRGLLLQRACALFFARHQRSASSRARIWASLSLTFVLSLLAQCYDKLVDDIKEKKKAQLEREKKKADAATEQDQKKESGGGTTLGERVEIKEEELPTLWVMSRFPSHFSTLFWLVFAHACSNPLQVRAPGRAWCRVLQPRASRRERRGWRAGGAVSQDKACDHILLNLLTMRSYVAGRYASSPQR